MCHSCFIPCSFSRNPGCFHVVWWLIMLQYIQGCRLLSHMIYISSFGYISRIGTAGHMVGEFSVVWVFSISIPTVAAPLCNYSGLGYLSPNILSSRWCWQYSVFSPFSLELSGTSVWFLIVVPLLLVNLSNFFFHVSVNHLGSFLKNVYSSPSIS